MEYLLHILVIAGIYVILTLGLNLILGYTGLPALGHSAFACVGAYTSALLALNFGWSPWLGLVCGMITAGAAGWLIAKATVRLSGDYFALATFGIAVIVYSVAKNWVGLTRGPLGLPGIPGFNLFGWPLSATWAYAILTLIIAALTFLVMKRIVDSPLGRILRGIREDEIAVMALGKDVDYYKTLVFVVGAAFAGIAGALYAHYITFIDPSSFTIVESITILLMVVFGGMGSLRGSIVGAVVLVVLPEALRFVGLPSSVAAPLRQMIYGGLLVFIMIKRPQGLLGKYRIN